MSDEALIRQTLAAYAAAYDRLDADGVQRVFPRVDRALVESTFKQARSQELQIDDLVIRVQGDRATASGRVTQTITPTRGGSRPTRATQATEFRLEKIGGTWVIVERRQL